MAKQSATGITWTDETWGPIRGCSRVSAGCKNCYAERIAYRFSGPGGPYEGLVRINAKGERQPQWNGTVRVVEDHMLDPLRWKRPRRIFVNSMSDLFHENLDDLSIDRIFAVMALSPQHTFQVLTKRAARMLEYWLPQKYNQPNGRNQHRLFWISQAIDELVPWRTPESIAAKERLLDGGALPNVWLGVSVENQTAADERIPLLLQTPAAVRWISAEPLLGPLDVEAWLPHEEFDHSPTCSDDFCALAGGYHDCEGRLYRSDGLDWVVVGGESGPGARPMHPEWARSLRDQCAAAGVAFHFKQWGGWAPNITGFIEDLRTGERKPLPDCGLVRVGKHAAGRELDGRTWDEYPEVRQ